MKIVFHFPFYFLLNKQKLILRGEYTKQFGMVDIYSVNCQDEPVKGRVGENKNPDRV